MKINMLVRARAHFHAGTRSQNRHNQIMWIRSIRRLGTRWLLHAPMPRPDTPVVPPLLSLIRSPVTVAPTPRRASSRNPK